MTRVHVPPEAIEAVLCEDGRTVVAMIRAERATLVAILTLLPMPVAENAFDAASWATLAHEKREDLQWRMHPA